VEIDQYWSQLLRTRIFHGEILGMLWVGIAGVGECVLAFQYIRLFINKKTNKRKEKKSIWPDNCMTSLCWVFLFCDYKYK
jgi:hypothetical protein